LAPSASDSTHKSRRTDLIIADKIEYQIRSDKIPAKIYLMQHKSRSRNIRMGVAINRSAKQNPLVPIGRLLRGRVDTNGDTSSVERTELY
jgi:hypothetical protein